MTFCRDIVFPKFFKIKTYLYVVNIMAMIVSNLEANGRVDTIHKMKSKMGA